MLGRASAAASCVAQHKSQYKLDADRPIEAYVATQNIKKEKKNEKNKKKKKNTNTTNMPDTQKFNIEHQENESRCRGNTETVQVKQNV